MTTFPLRLPVSLKALAERLAREDGVSLNQYVTLAVAEKATAARIFAELRRHADPAEFERIMNRKGGEPPREGDAWPKDIDRDAFMRSLGKP